VEEKTAHAHVNEAHLLKYRAFDLLQAIFGWHLNVAIKRSFTLIIEAMSRNIFAFTVVILLAFSWRILIFFLIIILLRWFQEFSFPPKDNFLLLRLGFPCLLILLFVFALVEPFVFLQIGHPKHIFLHVFLTVVLVAVGLGKSGTSFVVYTAHVHGVSAVLLGRVCWRSNLAVLIVHLGALTAFVRTIASVRLFVVVLQLAHSKEQVCCRLEPKILK
jgi:hypothetical protein